MFFNKDDIFEKALAKTKKADIINSFETKAIINATYLDQTIHQSFNNDKVILILYQYKNQSHFVLPDTSRMDQYYFPLKKSFPDFLARNHHSPLAKKLVEDVIQEIEFYQKFREYYGYVFYIAQKQ